jgi:hypothetical protein
LLKLRRVWRYQRGNQNPYIEEEQTTQWLKEKVQKDKKQSTKLAKGCGLDNSDDDDGARRRLVFPILLCGLWYTRHNYT